MAAAEETKGRAGISPLVFEGGGVEDDEEEDVSASGSNEVLLSVEKGAFAHLNRGKIKWL